MVTVDNDDESDNRGGWKGLSRARKTEQKKLRAEGPRRSKGQSDSGTPSSSMSASTYNKVWKVRDIEMVWRWTGRFRTNSTNQAYHGLSRA